MSQQEKTRKVVKVLKPVSVTEGGKTVTLEPSDGAVFSGRIDFDHPKIGVQDHTIRLVNGNFNHDLADCRTFGFMHEVEAMRKAGLALGGSLDNAIVLDDEAVLNPEGLRRQDEFVRHKLLDAVGDIYLAGYAIQGEYKGYKGGHDLNNRVLHALFSDQDAWTLVEMTPKASASAIQPDSAVDNSADTATILA